MAEEVKKEKVITQEEYNTLLARLDKFEKKENKPKRAVSHVASVMLWDEMPVVKFENVKTEEKEGADRQIHLVSSNKIVIHVLDGDKIVQKEVNYKSLVENSNRVMVEILKMSKEENVKPQGSIPERIRTSSTDPVGLREQGKSFAPEIVTLEQTLWKSEAEVRFVDGPLEGKEIKLDAYSLNR